MESNSRDISQVQHYWRLYRRDKIAVIALLYIILIVVIAILAPLITRFPPLLTGAGPSFTPPNAQHLMGTDDLGRDIFSGVIYGARVSMGVGFVAAVGSSLVGLLIGIVAAYYGRIYDTVLMRITEIFFVIPMVFLAILLVAFFGSSIWNVIFVIIILSWPTTARLVRGQVLALKERDFVKASKALGEHDFYIMFMEILPNTLAPIIVNGSIEVARAIVVEAGLSFLGLGDPNLTSWGIMLYKSQRFLVQQIWWTFSFPGAALFFTVLSLNVIADTLNTILNPRTRHKLVRP